MNNLPVDVMAAEARGPIIAVDVAGEIDLHADDERYGERDKRKTASGHEPFPIPVPPIGT